MENRYRPGWALALVTGACVLMTLDITIVNVALPEIRDALGSDLAGLQWIITGYTLAFASLLLTAGSLADATGRRRVFTFGVALFTLASLGCGLSTGVVMLDVMRAVQGVGGAFAFAPAMAIIAAHYTGPARTRAIAVFGAVSMAAGALGPLIGGALVQGIGWRSLFLVNVPLGAAVVWLTLRRMAPDGRRGGFRPDIPGALTLAAGMSAIVLALLRGEQQGWTSVATLAQAGTGALAMGVFAVLQRFGRHPLLDLSLFRIRSFTGTSVVALLARVVSFGLLAYLVLFLEAVYRLDALQIGVRLLALSLLFVVGGLAAARLADAVPPGAIVCAGFLISATGLAALRFADAGGSWARILPSLVLLGLGMGLVATPSMTIAMGVVHPSRTGTASGVINSFLPLGTALGTAAFGALYSARLDGGRRGPDDITGALALIGTVAALIALAGAVAGALLIRTSDLHTETPGTDAPPSLATAPGVDEQPKGS
ncbi:MFS transporter [Actinomadura madurae]|uniref:MFS transporter n=1 Tax=Actinomadura madurae TaxID=1993 RepID=UPI000D8BF90F|nr:MFS transporter [Actinomadura madurae]SPT58020.1 Spectinomycin tetracycline efflux pump [Actinomadura madurae]